MTEKAQRRAASSKDVPRERVLATRAVTDRMRDRLWAMYLDAFVDVSSQAVGSQLLEQVNFDQLMADPDTYKMIGVEGTEPVGMIMMSASLELIPGINVESLMARYPGQHARDAVFYVPFAFVASGAKSLRLYSRLITAASQIAAVRDGVIVLDMCRFLEASGQARLIRRALRAFPDARVEEIDAQVFYAATLPKAADLTFDVDLDAVDLVLDLSESDGVSVAPTAEG